MTGRIPENLLRQVQIAFNSFDKNNDGTLSGKEAIQSNAKRREQGLGSIYSVQKGMNIEDFYNKNISVFNSSPAYSQNASEIEAEMVFRDIDKNGNNKLSKKELKNRETKPLYKAYKDDTKESYVERVASDIEPYIKEMRKSNERFNNNHKKLNSQKFGLD
ncbi:EF-hand domain-containing protein [bacterium]|nr:EF-hand domain-containing protein [bacterium]